MSFLDNALSKLADDSSKLDGIQSAAGERRKQRQPRNISSSNNLNSIFDDAPQKKLGDADTASFSDVSNKSRRNADFSVETVAANNTTFESKAGVLDLEGSGLLAEASMRRSGRRGGDSSNNPTTPSISLPNPNKVKIDDFEDFDLENMLGLGGESSKKNTVSASSAAGKSNLTDSSLNDLPSFLKDSAGGISANTLSKGRRGRGSLGVNSPPQVSVDLFAGVSAQSKNAILVNPSEPKVQPSSKPSIFDILDRKSSNSAPNPTPKLSIFDILDKNNTKEHTPEVKIEAKNEATAKLESDDSLSSLALLSETDDDESGHEANRKQSSAKISITEEKSKKKSNSKKEDSVTIANLKEQVQKAKDEVEETRNELIATKQQLEKNKIALKADYEEKLANEKKEQEKTMTELEHARNEVELLRKQIEASKIEYEMKLAQEMQQHIQKMSDVMTNAEGVTKLHGLVNQVRDTTEKMEKIQLIVQEATDDSLKAREAAVSMKEVHLARIQDELQVSSRQMAQERKKLENLMLDVHDDKKLAELKRQQMEEKLEQEAIRLKNELSIAEKTKDALVFTLNQEKESFRLRTEAWNIERARLLEQVNKDKKEISMLKPLLESQSNNIKIQEQEMLEKMAHERNQLEGERRILEADQNELSYKQKLLHREEATLKTERLKLEEKQREIESMSTVYQKEVNELENKFMRISRMRDDAVNEKNEAQKIKELVEALQKNLDAKHTQCIQDLDRLSTSKKSYIDQRINKSYLLQEAMLQYPLLQHGYHEYQQKQPESNHHQQVSPQRPEHNPSVQFQNQSPVRVDALQNENNGSISMSHSANENVRYKRSEAERDLAAALELQLGAFMSKLNQGHSKRKLEYQRVVLNRTKL